MSIERWEQIQISLPNPCYHLYHKFVSLVDSSIHLRGWIEVF